jgi:hypothetical protein
VERVALRKNRLHVWTIISRKFDATPAGAVVEMASSPAAASEYPVLSETARSRDAEREGRERAASTTPEMPDAHTAAGTAETAASIRFPTMLPAVPLP